MPIDHQEHQKQLYIAIPRVSQLYHTDHLLVRYRRSLNVTNIFRHNNEIFQNGPIVVPALCLIIRRYLPMIGFRNLLQLFNIAKFYCIAFA